MPNICLFTCVVEIIVTQSLQIGLLRKSHKISLEKDDESKPITQTSSLGLSFTVGLNGLNSVNIQLGYSEISSALTY